MNMLVGVMVGVDDEEIDSLVECLEAAGVDFVPFD
jgi:hypothetical protein